MKWLEGNRIQIDPPKRPKKITGTRFAAISGLNKWTTPFATWCEITRTYEEPFEDTIYTIAGKTIEPKQAEYMKSAYLMDNLVTPEDVYGSNPFQTTHGDFFGGVKMFGGMWDYLLVDEDGHPSAVLEMKTTKRAEDWQTDVPEYYALQAALYAYLLGVDSVLMVASFLEDTDYKKPEGFVPSAANTIVIPFKVSERYPDMELRVEEARDWWRTHVEGGISPEYDEKKDAEILKELKRNSLAPDADLGALVAEAEEIQNRLAKVAEETAADEKRLKTLKDLIKEASVSQLRDGDKEVIIHGAEYDWVTSRSVSVKIDEEKLDADGLLAKYKTKITETIKLSPKKRKE